MQPISLLQTLSASMQFEPAEDADCRVGPPGLPSRISKEDITVSHAVLPNGKRIKLLKTLLTSACERDCFYCPFRAGRDFRRLTLKPDEMAAVTIALHQAGRIDGIFLSSGIAGGGVSTQDRLLDTAEILRHKLDYRGYLHLKIMPGADRAQVERTMQLADRVSINLEAPNDKRLELLAPKKSFFDELLAPLQWAKGIRQNLPPSLGWNHRWPSSVTQFVVGGAGETDRELLDMTEKLYRNLGLKRAYFSPFSPVPGTPLEHLPPEDPRREHRLYQSSFLIRDYGFLMHELPFESDGNLPAGIDPKLAWAKIHLEETPVELNRADKPTLLRIPGVGPRSVEIIMQARRENRLTELEHLSKIGLNASRMAPFILLNGQRAAAQMSFW